LLGLQGHAWECPEGREAGGWLRRRQRRSRDWWTLRRSRIGGHCGGAHSVCWPLASWTRGRFGLSMARSANLRRPSMSAGARPPASRVEARTTWNPCCARRDRFWPFHPVP
jgi:hypothetical protein